MPDDAQGRSIVFVLMLLNSGLMLLSKSLSFALLAMVGQIFVGLYVLGDMCLFLAYKIARKDFW